MSIDIKQVGWGLGLLLFGFGVAQAEEATLYWANRTALSSLASGEVAQVNAPAGTRAKKGDPLITLEQSVFTTRVQALQAIVKNTRGQRAEAKAELERNQEMYDQTMLALHDLQLSKLAYIKADADYQQARADLAHARFMQQQSLLRAPFDAIVLSVAVSPGEVVNNQQQSRELMVIASSDKMLARAQIDLEDAFGLKFGQPVTVNVGGKSVQGSISAIDLTGGTAGSSVVGGKATVDVIFPIEVNSDTAPGIKVDIDL
jgi:RND family efflux transporter MFP subunit